MPLSNAKCRNPTFCGMISTIFPSASYSVISSSYRFGDSALQSIGASTAMCTAGLSPFFSTISDSATSEISESVSFALTEPSVCVVVTFSETTKSAVVKSAFRFV